jgi:hypothetical protein
MLPGFLACAAWALCCAALHACIEHAPRVTGSPRSSLLKIEVRGATDIPFVAWSPDGKRLALTVCGEYEDTSLWVANVGTGNVRRVTDGPDDRFLTWSPQALVTFATCDCSQDGRLVSLLIYEIDADAGAKRSLGRVPETGPGLKWLDLPNCGCGDAASRWVFFDTQRPNPQERSDVLVMRFDRAGGTSGDVATAPALRASRPTCDATGNGLPPKKWTPE